MNVIMIINGEFDQNEFSKREVKICKKKLCSDIAGTASKTANVTNRVKILGHLLLFLISVFIYIHVLVYQYSNKYIAYKYTLM